MKQQVISLFTWLSVLIIVPAIMYLTFNISKTLWFSLFGLPAEFGYYFVSVDLDIIKQVSPSHRSFIYITSVSLSIAILYVIAYLGVWLLHYAQARSKHFLEIIGILLISLCLKPFISFMLMVYSWFNFGQLYWNLGDEMTLAKQLGLNEWFFVVALLLCSVLFWYYFLLKKLSYLKVRILVTATFIALPLGFRIYLVLGNELFGS